MLVLIHVVLTDFENAQSDVIMIVLAEFTAQFNNSNKHKILNILENITIGYRLYPK